MSKERELLNRCVVTLKARNICPLLLTEISELLDQPEQAPMPPRAPMTQREAYQRGYATARRDYKQKVINAFGEDDA